VSSHIVPVIETIVDVSRTSYLPPSPLGVEGATEITPPIILIGNELDGGRDSVKAVRPASLYGISGERTKR
jgi:hypothetical protein